MKKTVIGILLTFCIILALCGSVFSEETAQNTESETISEVTSDTEEVSDDEIRVGKHITFGSYEQDGDTSNGAEPISWEVLVIENDRALIVSDHCLDCQPYNDEAANITWESCTLRSWLNEEFYAEAFQESEKECIILSTQYNNANSVFGTYCGNETEDYVFLLSLDEVMEYYGISEEELHNNGVTSAHSELIVSPTQYAVDQGVEIDENDINAEGEAGCGWWLRSLGDFSSVKRAAVIYSSGVVSFWGFGIPASKVGVRPAMWISLE